MKGVYSERLDFLPASLDVSDDDFKIRFYFPGPDLRHNGRFFDIRSVDIDKYISAYEKNWEKFCETKKIILEGNLYIIGEMNMGIIIGNYRDGVCISSHDFCCATIAEVKNAIKDLQRAKIRGKQLLEILCNI